MLSTLGDTVLPPIGNTLLSTSGDTLLSTLGDTVLLTSGDTVLSTLGDTLLSTLFRAPGDREMGPFQTTEKWGLRPGDTDRQGEEEHQAHIGCTCFSNCLCSTINVFCNLTVLMYCERVNACDQLECVLRQFAAL